MLVTRSHNFVAALAHLVELLMALLLTSVSSLSPLRHCNGDSDETDVKSGAINSSTRWASSCPCRETNFILKAVDTIGN